MKKSLADFSDLPDEAMVPVTVVAALASKGIATIWREARTDERLRPIKLGGSTRFKVGDVRRYLMGRR